MSPLPGPQRCPSTRMRCKLTAGSLPFYSRHAMPRWYSVWELLLLTTSSVLLASNQTVAMSWNSVPRSQLVESQCRDREGAWEQDVFKLVTCAACYDYLFYQMQQGGLRAHGGWLLSQNSSIALPANVSNDMTRAAICASVDSDGCFRWQQCCEAAAACCETQLVAGNGMRDTCPRTWDGYACWADARPSATVHVPCPAFLPHVLPGVDAFKTCTANGTWYRDTKSGLEWSNFTRCLSSDNFKRNIFINIGCNSLSLLLLVPSVTVFLVYRPLRVQHRIRLHINLFASFILTNVVFVLWDILVVYDRLVSSTTESRMHANTAGCKFLYVLTRYTRCVNFLWMLSEAYYLHRLIAKAFAPPKSLVPFYLLAWGFPWVPVTVYSIVRSLYPEADKSCWVQNFGILEWLIYTPNLFSLATNFIFLSNILRILLTQLQAHPNEPSNYRRALKATFVLIPLFGLQLVFVIYRPPPGISGATEYAVFESVVTHSQGFFVALVFCFLNAEVMSHLRSSCGPRCRPVGNGWDAPHSLSVTTQVTQADVLPACPASVYIPMKPIMERANGDTK